jgi:hypothetical protein
MAADQPGQERSGSAGADSFPEDRVRQRLKTLIREHHADYAGLSRLIGRNPAYIHQFITRGVPRRLAEEDRRRLATHFGIDETELGAPASHIPVPASTAGRAYHLLPFLGYTGRTEAEPPHDALAFEAGFIRDLGISRLDALAAVRVGCDLMSPTLMAGDQLLLDAAALTPMRDGLHVLRIDGVITVRRVAVHPVSHRLTLLADNAAYPPVTDCEREALSLVGRVVWIGRRLG